MSATSRRRPGSSARHPHQISRGFAWLAIGALSAGTLAACGSSSASSASGSSGGKSTYTIHAILSLTGSESFLGDEEKSALMALQKHVNATGGIDGHPLAFALSDNQSTASTSVALASPLLSQAPIIMVGSSASTDKPVDSLVKSNGPVIYDLSPGDHPAPGSFVYSASNSTTNQTKAFIAFAESKGWKRIAAITSTDGTGQDGWANIQAAAAASNGAVSIVDHETFDPTDVSVATQLSKIKAKAPQALFVWTTGTPLGTVLKGMQQLNMLSTPTMTTNGNASASELKGLKSDLPAQLYFPGAPFEAGTSALPASLQAPVQTFETTMKAAGEVRPDEGNALSWDAGQILVAALRKLGVNATAAQIHKYISSLTDFAGINGTYNFTDKSIPDNRGLTLKSVYIAKWNSSQANWAAVSGAGG
jgi:branched-chain amino acid transport system substrate-binding protein